ncbi:hypothetical protein PsW64_04388 [Pseudovibrio sp. W64]|nr:hypothetical protein PsW64_04388 [Pseudovibrio sp. W64]
MECVAKLTQIKYKYCMGLSVVAKAHKSGLLTRVRRLGTLTKLEKDAGQHGQTNWKNTPLKTR